MKNKMDILSSQLTLTFLFIITLFVSIILTYDEKLELENKNRLFSEEFDKYLNLFNRIFALLIIIGILYVNYKNYDIKKDTTKNIKPLIHQIIASIFSVISALIVLYVVIENWNTNPNISSIENPIV